MSVKTFLRLAASWFYTPPVYGKPATITYHRSEQGEDLSGPNVTHKETEW